MGAKHTFRSFITTRGVLFTAPVGKCCGCRQTAALNLVGQRFPLPCVHRVCAAFPSSFPFPLLSFPLSPLLSSFLFPSLSFSFPFPLLSFSPSSPFPVLGNGWSCCSDAVIRQIHRKRFGAVAGAERWHNGRPGRRQQRSHSGQRGPARATTGGRLSHCRGKKRQGSESQLGPRCGRLPTAALPAASRALTSSRAARAPPPRSPDRSHSPELRGRPRVAPRPPRSPAPTARSHRRHRPQRRPAPPAPPPRPAARDPAGGGARCTCQSARHFRQPPPLPLGTPRWRRRVRATEPLWGRTALGAAAWRPRRTAAAGDRERRKERRRRPARRAERRGEARAGPRGRKRRRNLPLPRPAGRASHPATVRGRGAHARRGGRGSRLSSRAGPPFRGRGRPGFRNLLDSAREGRGAPCSPSCGSRPRAAVKVPRPPRAALPPESARAVLGAGARCWRAGPGNAEGPSSCSAAPAALWVRSPGSPAPRRGARSIVLGSSVGSVGSV